MESTSAAHHATPEGATNGASVRTADVSGLGDGWYRVLFERAAVPMALVSLEGQLLNANPRFRELLGYLAAEPLPQTMREITHPDDLAEQEAALARLAAGKDATLTLEHRYVRGGGAARRAKTMFSLLRDDAGAPAAIGVMVEPVVAPVAGRRGREREMREEGGAATDMTDMTDMTDRQRLEQALRDANTRLTLASLEAGARARRLETIFATMTDALIIWDADGQVTETNPAFREMFGTDARLDYLGMDLAGRRQLLRMRDDAGEPLAPDDLPLARFLRGEMLTGPNAVDVTFRSFDGREVRASVSGGPLRDAQGRIDGALGVFHDITARHALEREREHILHIVSHDLKTPLTTVKVLAQLMRRQSQPRAADLAARIERGIDQMDRMVSDLVDMARLDADGVTLDLKRCDLNMLCRQAAEDQGATTGRSIALELPESPLQLSADAAAIARVLANLLSNALKYSPRDTVVTLALRGEDGMAHVEVRDHGQGIGPDALPRLFERYYRAPGIQVLHGAGVNLGLGLYVSRRIVERHGGQMGVESAVGLGSAFWFTLPLASEPVAP
ncbi:MAG TPA: PAS domain S-box protein [Ktedonobacterales bacterium]|nr:PAS domain S-box protein [Ktedonobacterales bacterium]